MWTFAGIRMEENSCISWVKNWSDRFTSRVLHDLIPFLLISGDAMHTFMNDNWKAISQEFGDPMLEKPVEKIFTAMKTYLRSQPLDEIANV